MRDSDRRQPEATESRDQDVLSGGVRAAARRLGMGERAGYRAAARGDFPAIRVGGRWIVPLAAWHRFLMGEWSPAARSPSALTTTGRTDSRRGQALPM